MFSIQNKTENAFDKIILKDDTSGTFAEILPSCGAILHALVAIKDGEEINVIDSYESAEDFKSNVTSKGFKGSKLSPFVCRLNKGKYNFLHTSWLNGGKNIFSRVNERLKAFIHLICNGNS